MKRPNQQTDAGPEGGFHFRFKGDELAVRAALRRIRGAVESYVSADQLGLIELVLGEVLNNVVEHAYGPATTGQIEVECRSGEGALLFDVRDFGREMPEGELPAGLPIDIHHLREELPEGGFGWFLVRTLVRGLEYRRESGCNSLSFAIPIAKFKREGARANPAQGSG